jgi:signal transduction histidine kinase
VVRAIAVRKLRREIDALERQRAVDRERQATRDRIARDLHDEVSSTLSSMSLFVESSRARLPQAGGGAGAVLDRLQNLARDAEDAMEQAVWSLSSRHDRLGDLVARIRDVAYEMCADNDIRCEIIVGDVPGDIALPEQTRKNLYLIFRESLVNAVKHARAGMVEIRMDIEADRFLLSVRDNGRGFDPEEILPRSRGGNGLSNLRIRAAEMGGEMAVSSRPGKGTTVVFSMGIAHMRH